MSALELFRVLGDESDRPPSPPKHILKKKKQSQGEKTKRYWPGKVPDYVVDDDSYSDESSHEDEPQVKVDSEPDRRLNRYQITQVEVPEDVSERVRRRKAQVETITVYQSDQSKELEKSQKSLENKSNDNRLDTESSEKKLDRNTLRRLALEYRKQEEQKLLSMANDNKNDGKDLNKKGSSDNYFGSDNDEEEDVTDQSEDGSDYDEELEENDNDNDDNYNYNSSSNKHDRNRNNKNKNKHKDKENNENILVKPIFVPKGRRTTEYEKEQLRKEELIRKENEKKRLEERKKDTKEMLIKKFQEEESELEMKDVDEEELIDDTDVLDEKEYELWKIRELKRILRDKEDREKFKKLEEEVNMRRNMTDEERELDNKNIDKVVVEKSKLRFLQKYYHKGAFFMDKLQDKSEPIYARDFNAPTADDCIDKSMLPKPMRVRRGQYGKQGRVKHTHLKDVDTTQFDAWSKSDKYKLTGTKQVFDRPSKKK